MRTAFAFTGIYLALHLLSACVAGPLKTGNSLQRQLDSLAAAHRAVTGIAIIGSDPGDTFFHNADKPFIMMSVVKFPQAVVLMKHVRDGKTDLNAMVKIDSNMLRRDTWSPLADEHPHGDVEMRMRDCFVYSVSKSDNIVCDRLYDFLPPDKLQAMLHADGYSGINIAFRYRDMHKDSLHLNNSTPRHMAMLLRDFYAGKFSTAEDRNFLLNLMRRTETGPKRLKGSVPDLTIAHKTGTYFENDSFIAAINDVGIAEPGHGAKPYYIAVFVNNSLEGEARTEGLIAEINRLAYLYFKDKQ